MHNLSLAVVGERKKDRYTMWTGSGGNKKGITKSTADAAFGEYCYEPEVGIFSNRSASGLCLSSELSSLKGKRLCITSKCESKDSLRAGLIKQAPDMILSNPMIFTKLRLLGETSL